MKRTNINPGIAPSPLMTYIFDNKESKRPINSIDQFFLLMYSHWLDKSKKNI